MTKFDANAEARKIYKEFTYLGDLIPMIEKALLEAYERGRAENDHRNCVHRHEVDQAFLAGKKKAFKEAAKIAREAFAESIARQIQSKAKFCGENK